MVGRAPPVACASSRASWAGSMTSAAVHGSASARTTCAWKLSAAIAAIAIAVRKRERLHCGWEFMIARPFVAEGLLLKFLALPLQLDGGTTQRLRNVFVGAEPLQVYGVDHRQHMQSHIQRRFRIVEQVAHHRVVLAEVAVVGD